MAGYYFSLLSFSPVYTAEQQPDFQELRERLRTEPGLLISNHPGGSDILAILKTLDRRDVYFVTTDDNVDFYQGILDTKYLIPVTQDLGKLRQMLKRVKEVIENKGLVVLFPTGGEERTTKNLEFKSGFRAMVNLLEPEQMVYAFRLNMPEDAQGRTLAITADERYTTAKEWQAISQQSGSSETLNRELTQHYRKLFEK